MKIPQKYLFTGAVALIALLILMIKFWSYATNPWTRDGQVRADVLQLTPRVSGPIVDLPIRDNAFVKAGELLFEIDPRTFEASLAQARAQYDGTGDDNLALTKQVEAAEAQVEASTAAVRQAESAIRQLDAEVVKNAAELERQQELLPQKATSQKSVERAMANFEVSVQEREGAVASLAQSRAALNQAEAALAEARANLGAPGDANAEIRASRAAVRQAELNLEFTRVRAPVDGYVTNLNLQLGSQAVANQPALALIDASSFWVDGYFRETSVGNIRRGNKAVVTLMTYPDAPLEGYVDSLGWGIAQQDGSTGTDLLPNVSPTFEWIRLAQRVPVKVRLTKVPEEVRLRVGTTGSVLVLTDTDVE